LYLDCAEPTCVAGLTKLRGEVNVARFLIRRLKGVAPDNSAQSALEDDILDECHSLVVWGDSESAQKFVARLSSILTPKRNSLGQNGISMVDYLVSSALTNSNVPISQANVKKWMQSCSKVSGTTKPSKQNEPEVEQVSQSRDFGAKARVMSFLKSIDVDFDNVDHPEVFTVEAMMPYLKNIDGAVTKNLFLKDKNKKLYLLSTLHDRKIDLKEIAKKVGAKDISFWRRKSKKYSRLYYFGLS
jgi:hypothetical protein